MPNPVLLTLGALVIAVVAYWIGGAIREDVMKSAWIAERARWLGERLSDEAEFVRASRQHAFARAAEAVGCWPHRITKRADLMRHLESLGQPSSVSVVHGGAWHAPLEVSEFDAEASRDASPPVETPEPELAPVESYRQEGLL